MSLFVRNLILKDSLNLNYIDFVMFSPVLYQDYKYEIRQKFQYLIKSTLFILCDLSIIYTFFIYIFSPTSKLLYK